MVCTSVARPASPMNDLLYWNTLRKSQETVWAWAPRRVSQAIPTQFLPVIAIIAAPLYSRMDILYIGCLIYCFGLVASSDVCVFYGCVEMYVASWLVIV